MPKNDFTNYYIKQYFKAIKKMQVSQDRRSLINSMNNLIKHVCTNHNSQQQIFQSLQQKDFIKIITNLTDPKLQLRLISSRLLAQLLYESQKLQLKFCQIMEIPFSKETQLILNSNMDKILQSFPHKVPQIYTLIKSHHKMRRNLNKNIGTLLWFINPQKQILNIEYLSQQQLQQIINNNQNSVNPQDLAFDPMHCIFGILITSNQEMGAKNKLNLVWTENTLQSSGKDHDTKIKIKIKQKTRPIYFEPYIPYTTKTTIYQPPYPINLSRRVETEQANKSYHTPMSIKTERYPYSATTSFINGSFTDDSYRKQHEYSVNRMNSPNSAFQNNIDINPMKLDFSYLPKEQRNFIMGQKNDLSRPVQSMRYPFNNYASPKTERYNLSQHNARIQQKKAAQKIYMQNGFDDRLNNNWVSPSQKVKNIAMNGKNGWDTLKNVKLLAPSNCIPKYQYLN